MADQERDTSDRDAEERAAGHTEPEAPAGDARPPVVGIGASAGGLAALETFFSHVPENSGLTFVVVVHLSPEQESHLAEILQSAARIPVQQVTETVPLERDHAYVLPPGCSLNSVDSHLRLSELEEDRRHRAPIDHFFRALAQTHDGHSVGVILSGTGSDGALGIREIKEKDGLTIAQDPSEAEYGTMPQSAIATGLVDLILPLEEMPEAIIRYAGTRPRISVAEEREELLSEQQRTLHEVFAQILARTGRDFTTYKNSTILRRIQRRMRLGQVVELSDYLARLREDPHEVEALADDLLITVTNFFRDPAVWEAVEKDVIPGLFREKGPKDRVRAWSAGCATGEEAYTLAILLLEQAARMDAPPQIQVFASDLHDRSLARAREGFYAGEIEQDVSPERLARFFHEEDDGYRVREEVRDAVVFAPHDLLGDPPFSRVDLISCRNLLIYLQRPVQHDVVELFHHALRPDGLLVLGASEALTGSDLFQAESERNCIFRKRNVRGIHEILTLSRTEAGKEEVHWEEGDVAPIAREVVRGD